MTSFFRFAGTGGCTQHHHRRVNGLKARVAKEIVGFLKQNGQPAVIALERIDQVIGFPWLPSVSGQIDSAHTHLTVAEAQTRQAAVGGCKFGFEAGQRLTSKSGGRCQRPAAG